MNYEIIENHEIRVMYYEAKVIQLGFEDHTFKHKNHTLMDRKIYKSYQVDVNA